MGSLERLYAALPVWGQHTAVTAYGAYWRWVRFGPGFHAACRDYASRDRAAAAEFAEWQRTRLLQLLEIAATKVPYYRKMWTDEQRRGAFAGDLSCLPLLEKEPLRRAPQSFTREDLRPLVPLVFHSSGSTGTPIASHWTLGEMRRAMALREVRSAGWAGVSFARPRATFSGRMVEPDPNSKGPFHRYNAIERQVYLSPFHLSAANAPAYVSALAYHDVEWLTGYAVSFFLLARFILERRLTVPPLKAVITTSEKLTPDMRTVMEEAYRCRVFEEYSTVESALFASECDAGSLHVSPDVAITEILRPNGTSCAPGESGEVVATCLLRDYQPLIRFRLGDIAAWSPNLCACGREMPVLTAVIGRIEDVVVGPDGRELVRFHGVFTGQPHVQLGQVVQEAVDRIRVRVVVGDGFGERDELDLALRVKQRLGPGVNVVVERADRLETTSAGKVKAVISLIRRDTGAIVA